MKRFNISRKTLWDIYIFAKVTSDIILSLASFFIAYHLRFYNPIFTRLIPPIKGIPEIEKYYYFLPFFVTLCLLSYSYSGLYKKNVTKIFDEFIVCLKANFVALLLLVTVGFFYRSYEYSRVFMLTAIFVNFIFIFLWHISLDYFYQKYVKYFFGKPRVGFICSENTKAKILKYLKQNKMIKKFFLDTVNNKNDIENFVKTRNITELVIGYEIFTTTTFQQILPELVSLDVPIRVLVSLPVRLSDVLLDSTLGIPVVTLQPLSLIGVNFVIKRAMDIMISILVFCFLLIPLLFVCLLIYLFDGTPIFFVHRRVGYGGKIFKCVKFRTMVKDAHKMWRDLLRYSERGNKVFKLKQDPRVTPLGKLLRKYSIDEIPQFYNVLKGDMSIVGPRPQIVEEAEFYDAYAKRRLMILPGLTGLWQISGRADVGFEEMIDFDLYYMENWSIGLDIEIILKTIFAIFSTKGAY
ncbi:MAG: sugar transferase [Endomicrobia bacterium]|nr:sugar transferase [Endomicrobiia bacterium]MDW8055608.1 sugar transferase [Elusimicrobiota bacterium]